MNLDRGDRIRVDELHQQEELSAVPGVHRLTEKAPGYVGHAVGVRPFWYPRPPHGLA
jgi:hypothetical protein